MNSLNKNTAKGTQLTTVLLGCVFLFACTSLGVPTPNEIKEVAGDAVITSTVNNSLPWWQWLIVGTFIPSIFEMIGMLRRAILGGL